MSCSLYAAGSNSHGQLGVRDQEDRHRFTRVELPPDLAQPLDVLRIACGANHSILLSARGEVYASGSNQRGQLGSTERDAPPSFGFAPLKAEQLVRDAGLSVNSTRYTVHDIAASWETTFVVLRPSGAVSQGPQSDILLSLGANDWGERGVPSAQGACPTRVSFAHLVAEVFEDRARGDEEPIVRVIDLQAGPRHVCALVDIEKASSRDPNTSSSQQRPPRRMLLGWGASRQGQLGPSPSSSALPRITALPQPILLPSPYTADDVRQVSLGKDHTVISLRGSADGGRSGKAQVVLYGSDKHGQLGHDAARNEHALASSARQKTLTAMDLLPPETAHDGEIGEVRCTWNGTYLLVESTRIPPSDPTSNRLFSFGLNSHGQLGIASHSNAAAKDTLSSISAPRSLSFASPIRQFTCGSEHVLALVNSGESGEVYGWGWNEHGNLGTAFGSADSSACAGPTSTDLLQDVPEPKRVWPPVVHQFADTGRAVKVWAGNATSWILVAH